MSALCLEGTEIDVEFSSRLEEFDEDPGFSSEILQLKIAVDELQKSAISPGVDGLHRSNLYDSRNSRNHSREEHDTTELEFLLKLHCLRPKWLYYRELRDCQGWGASSSRENCGIQFEKKKE